MNAMTTRRGYAIGRSVPLPYEQAVTRMKDALQQQGFGVLTEIDVQATFKKKLDVDFRPYRILGACNPQLAHHALSVAPQVGLLLPCNVTVSQAGDQVEVSIVDPLGMLGLAGTPELEPVAEEARARLSRVAAALQA
jgi:uncharacterized protein (DUF302 family)